ncbi:MAG: glycosyltransferase family 4 protein [Bdellovibrionales bacterium]|nr:glycosyltransferase family 4 protein [Bdellovibrionales bacterium]
MKVLFTAYDFYPNTGGIATYAWEMANQLQQQGHQVLMLTKDRGLHRKEPFPVQYFSSLSSGVLSLLPMAKAIRSAVHSFQPEVIVNSLWLPGGLATRLAIGTQIPYHLIVHGMEVKNSVHSFKGLLRLGLNPIRRSVFDKAAGIHCVSEFTRALVFSETGVQRADVIHNGVNPERFLCLQPNSANYPQLVSVCRLVPHKGIDKVLLALPQVIEKFPELQYLIIGEGPDLNRLQQLTEQVHLQNHVQFLGKIDHQRLVQLYGQSHLNILMSRIEGQHVEGFGLVILEAACCKTPSLGGASGGITDAIVEGETGWLANPADEKLIAEKLIAILSDPKELVVRGQKAFTRATTEMTWEKAAEKLTSYLERPLA